MCERELGPFGQPCFTETDYLQAEIEILHFQIEHPEEYKRQKELKEKAQQELLMRMEAAKNIPNDYFEGWNIYKVISGDCLWSIAKKVYGSGTMWRKLLHDNDQQLPLRAYSISVGMNLRVKERGNK